MEIQIENVPIRTRWPGGGYKDEHRTITLQIETDDPPRLAAYMSQHRDSVIVAMQSSQELPACFSSGRWSDMGPPRTWIVRFV